MKKQVWLVLTVSLCFLYEAIGLEAPHYSKSKIEIAGEKLNVEIADNDAKREYGLMNRTKLADGEGMLFVFDQERILSFWMKDTLIPLDIGYFNKNKILIDIQTMKPISPMEVEPKVYPSKHPAQFALEVPEGWFAKHNVRLGLKYKNISK